MKCKIVAFIVLFFGLVSCHKTPKTPSDSPKKVLRLNCTHKPPTLDPRKTGDLISSTMQFILCEGLTRMNEYSTHDYAMCDFIDISDDQLTYTFHIKEAYWSDGSEVTAFDFERTYKELLAPGFPAPSAQLFYSIKGAKAAKEGTIESKDIGIKAINAKMLKITLEKPTPYFLELTSFCCLFPVHAKGISDQNYIGNGPFRIKSYKPDSEIIFERNPYYWDRKNVHLDEIQITFVSSDSTSFQMYENGEIDLIGFSFGTLPFDAIAQLKRENRMQTKPVAATSLLQFHTSSFPFSNKNLRKAIANAVCRQEIVDHIIQNNSEIAYSIIPTVLNGSSKPTHFEDGNTEKAKQYLELALEEMGATLEEINPLSYLYLKTERNERVVQAIAQQLNKIGLVIKPKAVEFNVLLDKLRRKDFQISQSAWIAQYNDAMNILERFTSRQNPNNDPDWENSRYLNLVEGSFFANNPEIRRAMLSAAENIFMDDLPQVPLYHWNNTYLIKPYVHGLYISPIGSVHLTNVDIRREGAP